MGTHWKQAVSDSQPPMPHHQKIPRCQQIKPLPGMCALHQLSSDCFKSYIWKAESKQGLWDKCHLRTRVHTLFFSTARIPALPTVQHTACLFRDCTNLTSAYQTARRHHIITWHQAWSDKGNRNDWGRCSLPPFWDHGVGWKPFLPQSSDSGQINWTQWPTHSNWGSSLKLTESYSCDAEVFGKIVFTTMNYRIQTEIPWSRFCWELEGWCWALPSPSALRQQCYPGGEPNRTLYVLHKEKKVNMSHTDVMDHS